MENEKLRKTRKRHFSEIKGIEKYTIEKDKKKEA